MKRFGLTQKNGEIRYGLSWIIDKPIANIIILEGMEEHSRRYDEFALYLNKQGFSVYCLDAYGQGENILPNQSNLGIWPFDGFSKQVDSEDALVNKLKETGVSTYLFCHSMGSFMGQSYIQRYAGQVNKVVLCGAGSKNPAVGIGYFLAKIITNKKNRDHKAGFLNKLMFGNFNKRIKNPETNYDWLSFNKDNVSKYIADPYCGFGPTNGFCLEFLKGMKNLFKKKNVKKVDPSIHLFLISGEEDPVTNYTKSTFILEKMYKEAGVKDVSIHIYKPGRHEIHNDDNREEVYRDVANFFLK